MNQQYLLLIRTVLMLVASALLTRGLISQETYDWLGGSATLDLIGAIGVAGTLAWGWWSTRPKAIVGSAGKLLDGKGAIIAPPAIANSSVTPDNVVSSLTEAAKVPGVITQ